MVSACSDAALVVSVGPGLDLRVGDNLDSRNDPPNKERSAGQDRSGAPSHWASWWANQWDKHGTSGHWDLGHPSSRKNTNNSIIDDLQLTVDCK